MGWAAALPVTLVIVPLMLAKLGPERYGLWAISTLFISYSGIAHLGMHTALVKYISEMNGAQRAREANALVGTVLISYLVIGTLLVLASLPVSVILVQRVFNVPEHLSAEAVLALRLGAVALSIQLILRTLLAIWQGYQRYHVSSILTTSTTLLGAAGTVIVLYMAESVPLLIAKDIIVTAIMAAAAGVWAHHTLPEISFLRLSVRKSVFKHILHYSVHIQLSGMAAMLSDLLLRTVVAVISPLSVVAQFDIAVRVVRAFRGAVTAALAPILPFSSNLSRIGHWKQLTVMYSQVLRSLVLVAGPTVIVAGFFAIPLMAVWLRSSYDLVPSTVQLLLVTWFAVLMMTPAYLIAQGSGRPHLCTVYHLTAGVLHLASVIWAAKFFGYWGVLTSYSVSTAVGICVFLILFHRTSPIPASASLRAINKSVAIAYLVIAIFAFQLSRGVTDWGVLSLGGSLMALTLAWGFLLLVTRNITLSDISSLVALRSRLKLRLRW